MSASFLLFALFAGAQENDDRYLIKEEQLYGFIDQYGKVIIEAQFHDASDFSEGLGAVRLNGTFGYIDPNGKPIIPYQFDVAFPFYRGIAKVYIEGKPYLIDRTGTIQFEHSFQNLIDLQPEKYFLAQTKSNKFGMINYKGKLILDTIFSYISEIQNGVAIVYGLNHDTYRNNASEERVYECGLIDTMGNWLVPYGTYQDIKGFVNGYALCDLIHSEPEKLHFEYGFINQQGKFLFKLPDGMNLDLFFHHPFHEGRAIVEIVLKDRSSEISTPFGFNRERTDYIGVIDTTGRLLFSNEAWDFMTPFQHNRAFVKDTNGFWMMIDREGKLVSPQLFSHVFCSNYQHFVDGFFDDGLAVVDINKDVFVIDTLGNIVDALDSISNEVYLTSRHGSYVLIRGKNDALGNGNYVGFWNIKERVFVEPKFDGVSESRVDKDLILVKINGKSGYCNLKGDVIWHMNDGFVANQKLNISYKNQGYAFANSTLKKDISANKRIRKSVKKNKLQIIINPKHAEKWHGKYKGMKVILANTSKDTFSFAAQDGRICMKMQALDKKGIWRDIELLANSTCGNSYHRVSLEPNRFFEFVAPVYEGEFKTKLRFCLIQFENISSNESLVLYSNEIEGSINPGQFWYEKYGLYFGQPDDH